MDQQEWVMVPPTDREQGEAALAAWEPLTQDTLEELVEGVPPAAELLMHEVSPVYQALLDEGDELDELDPAELELVMDELRDAEDGGQPARR